MSDFSSRELEILFWRTLGRSWRTRLEGGGEEPLYLPASGEQPARILYTSDYFRSALHEIAHWCIAGDQRRQRRDYGYWYAPDGRDAHQQRRFLRVEKKPQALELVFCAACGHDFFVSLDNLDGQGGDATAFEAAVFERARHWLEQGKLPMRAHAWVDALARRYERPFPNGKGLMEVFRRVA